MNPTSLADAARWVGVHHELRDNVVIAARALIDELERFDAGDRDLRRLRAAEHELRVKAAALRQWESTLHPDKRPAAEATSGADRAPSGDSEKALQAASEPGAVPAQPSPDPSSHAAAQQETREHTEEREVERLVATLTDDDAARVIYGGLPKLQQIVRRLLRGDAPRAPAGGDKS